MNTTPPYEHTKRKFLSLSTTIQHKKCAEILRLAYENPNSTHLTAYNEVANWLNLSILDEYNLKAISDRYHFHLNAASIKHKEHNLLPSVRQGDRLQGEPLWPIAIYLDNIRSAHNVGSIIRTVEAYALGTLYFSGQTPYVDHKQVQDAAMGSAEWVTCKKEFDFDCLPRPLIALETSSTAISVLDYTFPETFTLVMGNEEYGCSEKILQQADVILEIPLRGRKNSLNVANAFAIAAAEIYRQRKS